MKYWTCVKKNTLSPTSGSKRVSIEFRRNGLFYFFRVFYYFFMAKVINGNIRWPINGFGPFAKTPRGDPVFSARARNDIIRLLPGVHYYARREYWNSLSLKAPGVFFSVYLPSLSNVSESLLFCFLKHISDRNRSNFIKPL